MAKVCGWIGGVGALTGVLGLAASAVGQETFGFELDAAASSVQTTMDVVSPFTGTFIGNYDAVKNPTGTQTRPGLFGGSGNVPIPVQGSLQVNGNSTTNPGGTFEVDYFPALERFAIRGMELDMLRSARPSIDLILNIGFSTFRTFNPDSLYFGVPSLPLPLGSVELLSLTARQIEQVSGVLVAAGPGEWTFAIIVPMEIEGEVDTGTGPLAIPPTPAPIPMIGTLRVSPSAISMSIEGGFNTMQTLPAPSQGIENVPLDLPTILPPGQTAHLLFSASFGDTDVEVGQDVVIEAEGSIICRGDYDRNGVLDIFDFLEFGTDFAHDVPKADLDGNQILDIFDFLEFGSAFAAGCN